MRQPNTLWAGAESLNLNRRLQSPVIELVSLAQWLGPHRLANTGKPNQTLGRETFVSLTYLNGCSSKTKTVIRRREPKRCGDGY